MSEVTQGSSEPLATIAVAVVDDHQMVAEGLASLLASEVDLDVVGTAANVAATMALVEARRPDVLLLDYRLPDGDGVIAASEVLRRWPDTKVVMISALRDEDLLRRALAIGCSGFVPKDRGRTEIVAAVRAARRGETFVPKAMISALFGRLRPNEGGARNELTKREREVLGLLAKGRSTAVMSKELHLSEHTVRNHVRNILAKLGAHSKLEAVALAAREGLVTLEQPFA